MQVHPSRQAHVPRDEARPTAASSFEPNHHDRRSPPPSRRRSRSPARDAGRRASPEYENYDRVQSRRDDDREREEEGRRRERDEMKRERERKDEDRERRGMERESRRTPERELGNGYQGGRGGGYQGGQGGGGYQGQGGRGGAGGGGDDWFASRRKERDNSAVTIWPPSPRAPPRAASPSGKKLSSSKKHKSKSSRSRRHDTVSTDSETDSEEEERRRSKKHKSSNRSSHKSSKSRRHDDEERREVKPEGSESREVARVERVRDKVVEEDDEDMWMEKPSEAFVPEDGDEEVGPLPLYVPGQKGGRNSYGGALLKGEGSAMAAFVAEGERIPRRGEIGMESDQIERFEDMGYVMSGSRHRRMNAVRVRKENQVISAEERRGILKMQAEEKLKRENQIVASFKELVDSKLAGGR